MTDKQKMDKILQDLESDEHVQQMKNYTQHGKVSADSDQGRHAA